jgi:hypothetical protein
MVRKRDQVADMVRARIATGSLQPGAPVPSGPELAKETGFAVRTCQAAVLDLLREGALTRVSPTARPRVAGVGQEPEMQLARSLAERRHLAGLTQQELADKLGVHVTTVCHAETGRLWQARAFWDKADLALDARGSLLARYDAWKAGPAVTPPAGPLVPDVPAAPAWPDAPAVPDGIVITLPCDPIPVTVRWGDGSVTTVQPGPA